VRREGMQIELGLYWNAYRIVRKANRIVRHVRRWVRRPACDIRP
jgi:hypothetical protein